MNQEYLAIALLVVAAGYIATRLVRVFKPKGPGCGCGGCGCSGKEKLTSREG